MAVSYTHLDDSSGSIGGWEYYYPTVTAVLEDGTSVKIMNGNMLSLIHILLAKNKHYLIQNGIQAEIDCRHRTFTDKKWISFILNQLVLNLSLIHISAANDK